MTYLKECDIMGERPKGLGKVAENGTLNENGAFYSVQDINVLLENGGGSSGGGDLPTPTVADAGSVVVVDEQGKYALGEGGGISAPFITTVNDQDVLDKTYLEIKTAFLNGLNVFMCEIDEEEELEFYYPLSVITTVGIVYSVVFNGTTYSASSENDYPVAQY